MKSLVYPPELEAYWVKTAQAATKGTSLRDTLHRILPDIQRLADRFTLERPALHAAATPYLKDTRTCAAYSLFFTPQSYMRMAYILSERPLPPIGEKPLRILDLGAGTGGALWPLLDVLADRPSQVTAWDASRAALRCLHDAFSALRRSRWPQTILRTQAAAVKDYLPGPERYDYILLHYVLNELSAEERSTLLARAARSLAPEGTLILCEPLLHAEGDYMRDIRTAALQSFGLHPLAPCPHAGPCPLGEPCQCVRTWPLTQATQILNTALRRDLRHLAYSFLMLSPTPALSSTTGTLQVRLIAPPTHAKGHTICPACCPDGELHPIQLLHRHLDAPGRKAVRHLERGQCLALRDLLASRSAEAPWKGLPVDLAAPGAS
ncbi:MAG: methyltransferase [Verrucomicrobiota bacterium]|jgi:ribosomal protein RSM22 (predicted rRNA methylase)|nr:methyltransferase [Verrucomicrobiota bacterium]